MPKERKSQAPRRSSFGLSESDPAERRKSTHSRRRSRFNSVANLRKTVGPEFGNDYHSIESGKEDPEEPSSGFFSFLKRNPFSYFNSSKPSPVIPIKEEVKKEKDPSTPTDSTTGSTLSTASTSTISSRSSRGSISSISSSRGSFAELRAMEEELKGKRGKVYVASGTPPPPAKVARKSVVVHRSKKHKKEHTEKENAETETADLEYKEKNRRDKKSPKPEYAPQLPTRRIRTKSYLSVQMRPNTKAKVHPLSKSPKSSKRRKKSHRRPAIDVTNISESSAPDHTDSQSYLVSETTSNDTTAANPSRTNTEVESSVNVTEELTKSEITELLQEEAKEPEPEESDRYKTWKRKLGFTSEVIRLRNSRNKQSFKFTPVHNSVTGEIGGGRRSRASYVAFVEDPLRQDNIQRARDFRGWIRSAHLALPSKIGVPVDDSGDVLKAGLEAVETVDDKNADPRASYNQVLDNMQKHIRKSAFRANVLDMGHESESFGKRVSTLKLIPDHLTNKREYKKYLVEAGSDEAVNESKGGNKAAWLKKKAGTSFSVTHNLIRDLLYYCSIWRHTIREIHGRFGITTAVYFQCIRSLLVLNIAYFITIFVWLLIPEVAIDLTRPRPYNSEPSKGCYPSKGCKSFTPKINKRLKFYAQDLVTGEGFMENSYMYFSGFRDNTAESMCPLKPVADLEKQYEDPLSITAFRFILVSVVLFIINSVVISLRIIHYYQAAGMETKVHGMVQKNLFRMILCAWDFSCTDPDGARALHKSIRREFRELSGGLAKEKEEALNTALQNHSKNILFSKLAGKKWGQILIHWLLNAAVVLVCGCASTGIYFAYYSRILWITAENDKCNDFVPPPALLLIAPALFISITSELMTLFCTWCSKFETWSTAEYKNLTTFGRIGLYYIAIIAAIYGYAFKYSEFLVKESKKKGYASIVYSLCYEEKIGEEIYRVVVLHGLVHGCSSWLWILYYWIRRKVSKGFTKKPIFNPTHHTLDLFFVHTICGFGYLYCPLISLIFIIRLILLFYSHKYILSRHCSLPDHLSYVSEVSLPYFLTFFMSYFISTVLNVYIFVELDSSFTCGPFTHYHARKASAEASGNPAHYYTILGDVLMSVTSTGISKIFQPGIIWVFIFFLIGLVYTFKAWADGYASTLDNLHELLVYEKKDRDFLLEAIFNVVKEQNLDDDDMEDDEDDHDDDTDYIATPEEPRRRTSTWQDSPLAEGIFDFRKRNMGAHHAADHRHHPVYINPKDDLHKTIAKDKKSFLPSRKSHLPPVHGEHNYDGIKKNSIADVWIQAYLDVRKARKKSEELKNIEKLYGSGL